MEEKLCPAVIPPLGKARRRRECLVERFWMLMSLVVRCASTRGGRREQWEDRSRAGDKKAGRT